VWLAALVVIVGALALVSVLAKVPSSWYPRKLSHSAVEKYIDGNSKLGSPTDVKCNDGKDFTLKNDGDKFQCTASAGKSFTVTITDAGKADYQVK